MHTDVPSEMSGKKNLGIQQPTQKGRILFQRHETYIVNCFSHKFPINVMIARIFNE